jgi:hypothetical protein
MNTTSAIPATIPTVVLEPAAQALADALAAAGGPPLYTLSPQAARAVLDRAQAGTWSCRLPWLSPIPSQVVPTGKSPSPSCDPWTAMSARSRLHPRRRLDPRQLRDP